jgi:hypothetical protein
MTAIPEPNIESQTFENNQNYYDQGFHQLDLVLQVFSEIEFEECEFTECDFTQAQFKSCKFINCRFVQCNLSLVQLTYSRLFGVEFSDSKLIGIDWTLAQWPAFHRDFELRFKQCILNDSSFYGLTLHELVMEECKLRDVDFRECDLSESALTYCDFLGALFMRTNLQRGDLTESSNFNLDVTANNLAGTKFTRFEALSLLESLGIELVD